MKFKIDHEKTRYDSRTRLVIAVSILELEAGEVFDEETVKPIVDEIYMGQRWFLEHTNLLLCNQVFTTVFDFTCENTGQKLLVTRMHVKYTDF